MTFDRIVGLADGLPLPQKERLIEVLSKRVMQQRRQALRRDSREANREFKAGKCRVVTPAALMRELTR